jgi:HK97 family phage major capsid protein
VRNILAATAGIEPMGADERELRDAMELHKGHRLLGENIIPWGCLARTMTTTPGSKGGYTVDVSVLPMFGALRFDSSIIAAGATVYDGLQASALIPRLSTKPTMYWVGEGAAGTASDAALGSVSATPRTVLGIIPVSVQLLRQSNAEVTLRDVLRRGVADALDAAAIGGAGGVEPLGITKTPGVTTVSGTSLSYATIWGQIERLIAAGAKMNELFMVAGATAARILATRERAAGSGYILDGGRVAGVLCAVTPNVPASTLVLGVASQLAVSSWGPGIEVRTSQSRGFNTLEVDLRVMLQADVSVLNAEAFTVFATVT